MNATPLLQMLSIRKRFGALTALHGVNFELRRGEIHGLLGGNGAGKTTLMNVLYGLYRPDAGQILLRGQPVSIHSPRDAIQHGIGMVHQHFLQVPSFSVSENVVIGLRGSSRSAVEAQIAELSQRFGLSVKPRALIADLTIGLRQRVEILKALYRQVQILILDEPTTNLTPQEVDALFQSLRVMVDEGMSVVLITHKLREVASVCDRITVLREGRNVLSMARAGVSEERLVRAMVGEGLDLSKSLLFSHRDRVSDTPPDARDVLRVEGVRVLSDEDVPLVKDVSLAVREREILGLAGVAGNGQRELVEAVIGARPIVHGRILVDGHDHRDTRTLLAHGVAYIPEDRLGDGFLPTANVAQNLILGMQHEPPYQRRGLLDWRAIFQMSERLIREYNIRTAGPDDTGGNLSGGNIQRVMIARAFAQPRRLLIAHNPTHGLDIASTEFFFARLLERRRSGMATLFVGEDLDELMLLCDRIAVMYQGEIMGVLERRAFAKYRIGQLMSGVRAAQVGLVA